MQMFLVCRYETFENFQFDITVQRRGERTSYCEPLAFVGRVEHQRPPFPPPLCLAAATCQWFAPFALVPKRYGVHRKFIAELRRV